MSDLLLAARQVKYENRAFWRNPPAAFFTFAFPIMFLFIFNTVFGNDTLRLSGRSTSMSTFYVPALVAFSVISACYTNIAIGISFSREQGVLKRVRGTPLPPWVFLAGRIIHATLMAILLVVIVCAVGALVYDVDLPTNTLPSFLLALTVGAAAFASLGLAVTAVIPNADAAPAVVNASILPLLFISDIFFGPEASPDWLARIADLFPVRHFAQALLAAFNPFEAGSGFEGGHVAVMAAWGLAGIVVAARTFSWHPRG
ncbi:MAG: ABC transporter permease [Actinobacteria bacterium]|nr:ABC transporter permease [Actinomycetota bacterium]